MTVRWLAYFDTMTGEHVLMRDYLPAHKQWWLERLPYAVRIKSIKA